MTGNQWKEGIQPNIIGWFALHHKDGWWVGTERGATCYKTMEHARVALTILWQQEGGSRINYRIKAFTGAEVCTGEHALKKTAGQAIADYEKGTT
jgi:hypothetical protein